MTCNHILSGPTYHHLQVGQWCQLQLAYLIHSPRERGKSVWYINRMIFLYYLKLLIGFPVSVEKVMLLPRTSTRSSFCLSKSYLTLFPHPATLALHLDPEYTKLYEPQDPCTVVSSSRKFFTSFPSQPLHHRQFICIPIRMSSGKPWSIYKVVSHYKFQNYAVLVLLKTQHISDPLMSSLLCYKHPFYSGDNHLILFSKNPAQCPLHCHQQISAGLNLILKPAAVWSKDETGPLCWVGVLCESIKLFRNVYLGIYMN